MGVARIGVKNVQFVDYKFQKLSVLSKKCSKTIEQAMVDPFDMGLCVLFYRGIQQILKHLVM